MRRALPTVALGLIVVIGCALRIDAAGGGLWVDEAWSAVYARDAVDALGVFVSINHDNNHHLNTLWMQAAGFDAHPLALRALSIGTGTATILVAASIGAQISRPAALVAALLFAISPILINYGSEARGYAPMLLCAMGAIALVQRWLADPKPGVRMALALGLLSLIGMVSQLTMIFFVAALAAWAYLTLSRAHPQSRAIALTARLMWPSGLAIVLMMAVFFGAAAMSPLGMRVGGYEPFSLATLFRGLSTMAGASFGLSSWPVAALIGVALLTAAFTLWSWRRREREAGLYVVALFAFPAAFLLLQVGNAGFARYYLLTSVTLLLLASTVIARALQNKGWPRALAGLSLAVITLSCLTEVRREIQQARGDIDAAVRAMAQSAPTGATVLIAREQHLAPLEMSATRNRYRIAVAGRCRAADFIMVNLAEAEQPPPRLARCGQSFRYVTMRRRGTLSGVSWALYRRD